MVHARWAPPKPGYVRLGLVDLANPHLSYPNLTMRNRFFEGTSLLNLVKLDNGKCVWWPIFVQYCNTVSDSHDFSFDSH